MIKLRTRLIIKLMKLLSYRHNGVDKSLNIENLRKYLQRKGYVSNMILGETVFIKGFVCVCILGNNIEVWHDTELKTKMVIDKSFLSTLPIALNYMETI